MERIPASTHPPSWWSTLREALAGSEQDYTEGPLPRAVLLLAVPMVLEMVMESLFAVVDVFFVARLGADAIATVGLTEGVLTLVMATAIGMSTATTATVARRIGEQDADGAAVAAVQAIVLGICISLAMGAAGALLAPHILGWMGASDAIVRQGSGYTRVMLGGSFAIFLLFLNNAIFRGAGDAATAMRALSGANALNILLCPCLIFGLGPFPELGLTGAAVATTIGRGSGVAWQLWKLGSGHGRLALRRRHLRLDFAVMGRLLRLAAGGIGQYLVATASYLGLVRIMALFGSAALAGYTIAIRIIIFTILPSWGLSNAAATLVGQNLGAGKPDRAERAAWITGHYNMAFLAFVSLLFFFGAPAMVGVFTSEPAVAEMGALALRWIASCYVFYAYGLVMMQALNGAGDTTTPTLLNFLCYWVWQIPVAWWLSQHTDLGAQGVFIAIATSETLFAVLGVAIFRRGKWKLRRV